MNHLVGIFSLVKESRGFTILEASIGIAVLAIGVLAAATMQFGTVNNNTTGNVFTQANMLAQQQMELIKNMEMDDMDGISPGNEANIDENGDPGGIYNRSWTVTPYPDPADLDSQSRDVVVTVTWTRPPGGTRTISVQSITRGGGI